MRKTLLCAAATISLTALALSVPSVAQAKTASPAASTTIDWGTCASPALQRRGAECGLAHRAARLREARRHEDQARGLPDQAHRRPTRLPGRHAGQPRRPGRLRPDALGARRVRAQATPAAAYDWIGFDPRGVGASKPALTCDPDYAGYNRPDYVPTTRSDREDLAQPDRGLRRRCDENGGALLDHLKTTDTGQGHGEHPPGAGRGADQLLRLLVRHLPRPGLRHAVPRAGAPHGASTATSTRAGSGTTPTSTRTSRSTATSRSTSAGSPSTTRLSPRPPAPAVRRAVLRHAAEAATANPAGRQDRPGTSGPTSSCRPATTSSAGPTLADAFAAWVNDDDARRRSRRPTTRRQRPGRRQRLRHLPRRPVHRRAVAAELGDVEPGQLADPRHGAVRDLGQRLVQRALPTWPAKAGTPVKVDGGKVPRDPADQRDAGRGHAVSRAASRSASGSRGRLIEGPAAPRTPARCSATPVSTTRSPPT